MDNDKAKSLYKLTNEQLIQQHEALNILMEWADELLNVDIPNIANMEKDCDLDAINKKLDALQELLDNMPVSR